ncbi:acyl-CoA dehydrogenase family protein [Amycolatopsis endophytica]|uniref:Alkylation response protein AidB-like acyl-CoA dehydrogenase n=1 Tax=Amycolatopsis endophytica TaxID=860233 RepID=A0A853B1Z3_9PSEU|nr:acyl-CoA dehydrogenase family protein [Amycolatopsis endophytica]NYI88837.1 alkylation response protein AidB-like acyl-CoA dehydrogenase [Amycolatopsis endophytica]
MDLEFDTRNEQFRREVSAWLDENAPAGRLSPPATAEGLRQHLAWERRLFEAGYAAPGWPRRFGGLGLDLWGETVFDEEYVRRRLPERLNKMALIHGARTVLVHGTEEQQRNWLPGVLDCSDIWCQGFSEPDAGSDLASLRTTGRLDGDEIVLNGQKTWTSNGAIATHMYALVRTDPAAPKHHGISFLVFDLRTPGVEIRPMRQLHGHSGFAEVFFTDVRVPLTSVVGELNDGWRVAQTALRLERGSARGSHTRLVAALDALTEAAARAGADRGLRERVGSLRAWVFAYVRATYALIDTVDRGGDDGVVASVNKLGLSEIQTAIHDLWLEVLGDEAELVDELGPDGELLGLRRDYWHSRAQEIFAGSSEIQRNIIAERGLGLPREVSR